MGMVLRSTAFPDLGWIPDRYVSEPHRSPPLVWWNVPREARSFALVCDDLDAKDGRCLRWALCDIPAQKRAIVEGYPSIRRTRYTCQGTNDLGTLGYHGACGRDGARTRHLRFRLFALGVPTLGLAPGVCGRAIFARAVEASLEVAQLVGARPWYGATELDEAATATATAPDGARAAVTRGPREPSAPGRAPG
jgi:Raf kinase inhibitor-like YbhB/YbcL family protein